MNGSDGAEFLLVSNHNTPVSPGSWLRDGSQRLVSVVLHNARRADGDVSTFGSGENAGPGIL